VVPFTFAVYGAGVSLDERLIPFDACFNFRDLGGYPTTDGRRVGTGRLYRSDTLHRFTAADVDLFTSLGVRTVVDLRTATELEDHGSLGEGGRRSLTWHHVPLFDAVMRLQPTQSDDPPTSDAATSLRDLPLDETYFRMLGDGAGFARTFELFARPTDRPAVFHCTSGKDRTGMVSAMILDLLGVEDDVIADDYLLTNETRERATAWIAINEPRFAVFLAQIPTERRHLQPGTILGFLDHVRSTHGSVEKLLLGRGVSAETIDLFRRDLIEG
jgi:protein-tyrosine phosphatase